jgi:DNA-directed RNA polymerase subunit RPC12/RpoP
MIEELGDDSRQILCERCRKFVTLSQIRYMPKGNDSRMALCQKCLALFNVEAEKKKKVSDENKRLLNRPSYFCSRCRYKFKFDAGSSANLRCPYCGKSDKVIEEKQTDTDTLIRQAGDY